MIKHLILLSSIVIASLCSAATAAGNPPKMPPTLVTAMQVKTTPWQEKIIAVGTLRAFQGTDITAEIPGRVTQIGFKSGQYVKKGDVLVKLFQDVFKANVDLYRSELELNKLNMKRIAKLYKTHTIAKVDYDNAVSKLASSKAKLDQAQASLSQATIRAPFSGKLGLRNISIGDYINPGYKIVNLQMLDPIDVDFNIPEVYLSKAKNNQSITISSTGHNEKAFRGHVYALDSSVDTTTHSLAARAHIENQKHLLVPGTFVQVTLALGKALNVIKVPQTAIVYEANGHYVYKIVKGKAVKTAVTLSRQTKNNMIITKGLKVGDQVITTGQLKVHDNAPVMIKK